MSILTRDAKIIIYLGTIHAITGAFFGAFLVSYMMQIADNQLLSISIYNILKFALIGIGFWILADFVKRKNKMLVYRGGIILQLFCLLVMAIVQDGIAPYLAILGAIYGFAMAMRHCPFNVIMAEKINEKITTAFVGYRTMFGKSASVITPLLLGLFITIGSYPFMALVMCFVLLFEFYLSYQLHSNTAQKSRFNIKRFLQSARRSILVRRVLLVDALKGFSGDALSTALVVYAVYLLHTDFNLGLLMSGLAIVGIALSYIFGKYAKPQMFPRILLISNIIMLSFLVLFMGTSGIVMFIIFRIALWIPANIVGKIREVNLIDASNSACVGPDCKTEFWVFRDAVLNVGRVLGFGTLLAIGVWGTFDMLKYFIAVMTIIFVMVSALSIKISRHRK